MTPGPFEAESLLTVYVHDWMMHGDGDYIGDGMTAFQVGRDSAPDVPSIRYSIDESTDWLILSVDDYGFVTLTQYPEEEYQKILDSLSGDPEERRPGP